MDAPPAVWLTAHAHLLPLTGKALDLACGRGRHALWLAARGLSVCALDRNLTALAELEQSAAARRLNISTRVVDLEEDGGGLGNAEFDAIVVVHYLHRPLFPAILSALRPGGVLVYETFTRAQATLGKPTNPDFLLESGELLGLVEPLTVLDAREGFHEGRHIASVVAQRSQKQPAPS